MVRLLRRTCTMWLAIFLWAACPASGPYAALALAAPPASQLKLTSAYLYNFLLFAHWPEDGSELAGQATMTVCILGDEALAEQFGPVEGKAIKGSHYRLRVKPIQPPLRQSDLQGCALLFIGQRAGLSVSEVLAQLKGRPILTVSDLPDFAAQGGMLALVEVDGKLRWQANQAAAELNGLHLDAQLLRNATAVIKTGEGH